MPHGSEIKASRLRLGWSQENLAKMVGTKQQTIDRIEKDKILHSRWTPAILQVLGLNAETDYRPAHQQVPVVGYVGAGEVIYGVDDYTKGDGLHHIDVPSGIMSLGTVALIVRGDSMLPVYRNGDIVFYDRQYSGNLDHLTLYEDAFNQPIRGFPDSPAMAQAAFFGSAARRRQVSIDLVNRVLIGFDHQANRVS